MSQSEELNQETNMKDKEQSDRSIEIIRQIQSFLQLFMCETLAKRILSMILIAVGISNKRVTELTGLCDKSVRILKKTLEAGEIESLFQVSGGGRKSKLVNIESAILEEINNNDYHSRQQIADMIKEKFGVTVSVDSVARLLKKTVSNG